MTLLYLRHVFVYNAPECFRCFYCYELCGELGWSLEPCWRYTAARQLWVATPSSTVEPQQYIITGE
jgi:hypothetical protein